MRLVEARLGRKDRVVELLAPGRDAGFDSHPLELIAGERRLDVGIQELGAGLAELAVRNPAVLAEDNDRGVLLGLDRDLGGEPCAEQVRANGLTETRLGQEQEVSRAPRRTTTSGAISRDFGVKRSAWHGAAVTSFDTIRWRKSSASGPATLT